MSTSKSAIVARPLPRSGFKWFLRRLVLQRYLILLVLPAFLIILVFHYFPIYGLVIAFKDYGIGKGVWGSKWVGLKWFVQFLTNPFAFRLFRNTILLGVFSLAWGFPAPIILALLLNEIGSKRFKKVTQTISYLPYFISTVVMVGMMRDIFAMSGPVNALLSNFGIKAILFFDIPGWFRPLFIGSNIWQGVGWGSIIYLAALSGVDPQLHEAAMIDGANRWHRMRHVSIPSIMPTIVVLFILSVGGVLGSDFMKVLLMYSPLTYESADIIGTYVFREGIENTNYSYASAVGFFMAVISFLLVFTTNKISQKVSETSLW
jgi:putative aldouronate transport system permease protein